ncbi:unnamed protein product [Adineta ricciae]|uniref:GNAT family N-acetyltransferase n=1 Tax=Adineta ricciae TaxID=249248 RepID=A0A815G746_ADIRI|nr:unnamed protein product [Adineta ricciae]CAF1334829.1 unnamed protein product [Adineta ricciae]
MTTASLSITHIIPPDEAEQTMVDIESLAKKVYQSSIVLSADLLLGWYQRNPFMWWIARENRRFIGYMSVIPVKHEAFLKTLQFDFDERTHITNDDIRTWNDGIDDKYSIYICSMVVDPDYQKHPKLPVYRLIVKSFLESLLSYGENRSVVIEWSGMAVSEAGCYLLQNYFDLTLVDRDHHNNSIFYGKTSIEHQQQLLQRLLRKL